MKRVSLVLLLLIASSSAFGQFSLGATDEYLKKRAEAEELQRVQDSIRQAELEEQQWMANDIRYLVKWNNMLTYRQSIGIIQNTYNLSYYGYLNSNEKWIFPISLRLTGSEEFNEKNMATGFNDWSQWVTEFGLSGFKRIKGENYFSLGFHLPLGWERYRLPSETSAVKKHWHGLIGLRAEERMLYISDKKTGLVLSAGFYQLLLNSKRYTLDAGFSLEVGLKF
jgi:hypothetical protein